MGFVGAGGQLYEFRSDMTPLVISTQNLVFTLKGFEVPSELKSLGGEQMFSIHQFIGGRRTLTPFGAAPHETITWSGYLSGPDAYNRALTLDSIRQNGQAATLTYAKWVYTGLVTKVWIEPGHAGWIPYRLEFTPASDQSQGGANNPPANPDAALNDAIAAAQTEISGYDGTNAILIEQMALIGAALTQVVSTLASSGGSLNGVPLNSLAGSVQIFTSALSVLEPIGFIPLPSMLISAGNVVAQVEAATAAMSDMLTAYNVTLQLQQLIFLLGNPPVNVVTVTVTDPNLLVLAAQNYGDAGQWQTISNANGGFPLFATGTYTLILPQPE